MHLELSFDLGELASETAEAVAFACGASAVTFADGADAPVLEPAPGEFRLWPATQLRCLFPGNGDGAGRARLLAAALGIDPARIRAREVADRAWEREWLVDFHALRFGRRLWICPHHEQVTEPGAVVVRLDPGLAFGTGTHPSTALCLEWLDAQLAPGAVVIDYGCGSGVLALAAARLGARSAHAFDIDPQALIAVRDNAAANGLADRIRMHERADTLPESADVLLANILAGTLCELAVGFAARVRPQGSVVLAGLMTHEAAEVTAAYAPWFDVSGAGSRDDWTCLTGRRR